MKPILFSTPMVQAILEGRKTQTRRIIKEITTKENGKVEFSFKGHSASNVDVEDLNDPFFGCVRHAKYQVGDILWVRETFIDTYIPDCVPVGEIYYKADYPNIRGLKGLKWKPSIHMPREAARIFLEVTNVRVERLQNISEEDAIAEGIELIEHNCFKNYMQGKPWIFDGKNQNGYEFLEDPIGSFASLWQSINANWNENPWVFVYDFKIFSEKI